jgi:CheY-like chemotaxis protein
MPVANQEASFRPVRILIVDDNEDAATSLALLLNIAGNETLTAHDGLQAIETAARFHPDVVLLDIDLPRLNGYDACRRIREQPWSKDTVLVALTGGRLDEQEHVSRNAGFDHHLVKPVEFDVLKGLLAEVP